MQVTHTHGIRSRIGLPAVLPVLALVAAALLLPGKGQAEERKFIVNMAHSYKQVGDDEADPDVKLNGPDSVHEAYFAEDQISFKRFWEEVSYGDVTIDGTVLPFAYLPWPLEPPSDVLDEGNQNGLYVNGTIPYTDLDRSRSFNYGEGEGFYEVEQMFEVDWDGNYNFWSDAEVPVPIADDDDGEEVDFVPFNEHWEWASRAKVGLIDGVWTPGERFRDVDGDERWDYAEVGPDLGGYCPNDETYDPTTVISLALVSGEGAVETCSPGAGQAQLCGCTDSDSDLEVYDPGEPWEDFLVRYDPTRAEGYRWVMVTEEYLRKNYPGDAQALIARMGNFTWDGPDSWTEALGEDQPENLTPQGTTKLQHAGRSLVLVGHKTTPRPPWLTAMWLDRYGTTPPAWGDVVTGEGIPEIIPFDPTRPDPAIDRVNPPEEETRRQFVPGVYDKQLKRSYRAYNPPLLNADGDPENPIYSPELEDERDSGSLQPDTTGVYDGPVEFDDLASSIYHDPPDVQWRYRYSNGDLRLGEVTSPFITPENPSNPDDLDPIWGEDRRNNDPYEPTIGQTQPDNIIWSAGPYAFRIHGNKLMDGGNQLSIELLTWRTDGQGTTVPKPSKVPLGSLWNQPNPANPGLTYRQTFLGSTEPFDNFDGGGGYSLAEACNDPAFFGDYGIRGLAYYDGHFYLAKQGSYDSQDVSVVSVMGPRVVQTDENLPDDCPNPVVDSTPIADTTVFEALSWELWSRGLTDIQAVEFDPAGTLYAINAATDQLIIVANPFDPDPDVQVFTLSSQQTGVNNAMIDITGLAYHVDNGVLYGADNQMKILWEIDTQSDPPGDYYIAIANMSPGGSYGNVHGIAYDPTYGGFVKPIKAIFDGGGSELATARLVHMDPGDGTIQVMTSWAWSQHQFYDLIVDEGGVIYGVDVLDASMRQIIGQSLFAELAGPGVCLSPQDSDADGLWDRRDENFCDLNGNELYDYAGLRDFNLDGLIDQGETIVPNGMNYLNDVNPASSNDGVHGEYPFNRVRMLEEMVEINDHEVDWTDWAAGGQLPDRVYGTTLVSPVDNAFGDIREHSPALRQINTRDQPEPFDNLIPNQRPWGFVFAEFDGGESYTDTSGNEHYDSGEPFNDYGLDGMPGTNDTGEGNGELDGEPYIDVNGNGKWDYGSYVISTDLAGPVRDDLLSNARVTAHEYGHFWENYRDLYDIVAASQGGNATGPVGNWDLMGTGPMVHPAPMHKELPGSTCGQGIQHEPWIDVIDLTEVLTPGVEQTITVNSCEQSRQKAYYVYGNMDRPAERFYFWRVSNDLLMPDGVPTVNSQLPGKGVLIMHVDSTICGSGVCGSGLCQQQPDPWVYKLVQADGQFHLQDGANQGDGSDPFGQGSLVFDWLTERGDNEWNNGAVTGIEITNIQEFSTASLITFLWTPQDVPWLRFIRPPGGESSQNIYQIAYRASDRFGGALMEFYMDGPYASGDPDPTELDGPNVRPLCVILNPDGSPQAPTDCTGDATQVPKAVGTVDSSFPVDLLDLEDGDYFFFVRLVPGEGQGGNFEQEASVARPPRDTDGNANTGNGWLTGTDDPDPEDGPDNITPPVVDISVSLLETWTVVCVDNAVPGAEEWTVSGSRSSSHQRAQTGVDYDLANHGEVQFRVVAGDTDFAIGDRFIFRTTGKTPFSARLRVKNHSVSIAPTAAFTAAPLTGGAPVTVTLDASESFDPESGGNTTLDFLWNFGDGTTGTDMATVHEYTEAGEYTVNLTVTSQITGYFDTAVAVQIIVTENQSPVACVDTIPPGGDFSGDTGAIGFELVVTAECSSDPDNDLLLVDFDFDDPYADPLTNPSVITDQAEDAVVSHIYTVEGQYDLAVTVREADGSGTDTFVQPVNVTGNGAPTAAISADPIGGPVPLTVTFNAAGTTDSDDNIVDLFFEWDFGDGSPVESGLGLTIVVHDYTTTAPPEGYTAQVAVTDTLGVSGTASVKIYAGNQKPSANIILPASPPTVSKQDPILFRAQENTDPDGDVLSYHWDFDNGEAADGSEVQYAYSSVGTYTVVLTVDDAKGGVDTDTIIVTVEQNDPPTVVLKADPTTGGPPLTVDFSAVGTSDAQTPVADLLFTWNFGDGSPSVTGYNLITQSYTYDAAAIYRATLTVSDGVLQSQKSVDITVRIPPPGPPSAALTADPSSGPAPMTVTFDASGTTDPDDDLATFLWEYGDGSIARESLATVTVITHQYSEAGTYTARLTAFDMQGRSSVAVVEIIVDEGGEAAVTPPAGACGFGMVETLTFGLVSLAGLRVGARRRRRPR